MCSGLATAMTVRVRVIWVLRMLSWDGPVQMARYALVRGVPLFCFFLRTPFLLLPDFLGWFLFPFFFFLRAEDLPWAHVGVVCSFKQADSPSR